MTDEPQFFNDLADLLSKGNFKANQKENGRI